MTSNTPFENRPPEPASSDADGGSLVSKPLVVNGAPVHADAESTARLDEVLRRKLGLKSVLRGCESGGCGSCRVIVNDTLVASCTLRFGEVAPESRIETAEGVQHHERVRLVLRAFVAERNTRCALCLGGLAMATVHLDRAECTHDETAIDRVLDGASCACTGRGSLKRALTAV